MVSGPHGPYYHQTTIKADNSEDEDASEGGEIADEAMDLAKHEAEGPLLVHDLLHKGRDATHREEEVGHSQVEIADGGEGFVFLSGNYDPHDQPIAGNTQNQDDHIGDDSDMAHDFFHCGNITEAIRDVHGCLKKE